MSTYVNDATIKEKLIGTAILAPDYNKNVHAADNHINPNGIELRLGNEVRFLTSSNNDHKMEIKEGCYLILKPGDSALVSSYEKLDFSKETSLKLFNNKYLMGLIHPTTTMMREGVSQVATKIDPGFKGTLSWMIRNNSAHDIVIKSKEALYKMTIMLLDENEKPDTFYGDSDEHQYQNSMGVTDSKRSIPSHIPREQRVELPNESGDHNLTKLKEQGYPFNYVAQEFHRIDGEFDAVNQKIDRLENKIQETKNALSEKIEGETKDITYKISEIQNQFSANLDNGLKKFEENIQETIMDKVRAIVDGNNSKVIAILIAAITFIASTSGLIFTFAKELPPWGLPVIGLIFSILILILWATLSKKE